MDCRVRAATANEEARQEGARTTSVEGPEETGKKRESLGAFLGYSSCLTPLSQHPDHHRGRGSRATVSSSGWNAARSLRARPPQDQVHTVGGSGLMQTAMPQRAGGWERLGFHKLPWGTDSGGACRDLCHKPHLLQTSHGPPPPSPPGEEGSRQSREAV